jgi:hypothetical protein
VPTSQATTADEVNAPARADDRGAEVGSVVLGPPADKTTGGGLGGAPSTSTTGDVTSSAVAETSTGTDVGVEQSDGSTNDAAPPSQDHEQGKSGGGGGGLFSRFTENFTKSS